MQQGKDEADSDVPDIMHGNGVTARRLRLKSLSYGVGGAAYRTRTCDPLITNEVLYQLS